MLPCLFGLFWPSFELWQKMKKKKVHNISLLDLSASPQIKINWQLIVPSYLLPLWSVNLTSGRYCMPLPSISFKILHFRSVKWNLSTCIDIDSPFRFILAVFLQRFPKQVGSSVNKMGNASHITRANTLVFIALVDICAKSQYVLFSGHAYHQPWEEMQFGLKVIFRLSAIQAHKHNMPRSPYANDRETKETSFIFFVE